MYTTGYEDKYKNYFPDTHFLIEIQNNNVNLYRAVTAKTSDELYSLVEHFKKLFPLNSYVYVVARFPEGVPLTEIEAYTNQFCRFSRAQLNEIVEKYSGIRL